MRGGERTIGPHVHERGEIVEAGEAIEFRGVGFLQLGGKGFELLRVGRFPRASGSPVDEFGALEGFTEEVAKTAVKFVNLLLPGTVGRSPTPRR